MTVGKWAADLGPRTAGLPPACEYSLKHVCFFFTVAIQPLIVATTYAIVRVKASFS